MSDKSAIIKEAQKYLARGQIDKAIFEWEKLANDYPDGATFNTIGDLYLRKGSKSDAVVSFHKAADFFRREGFSLKALALYKKILNINPGDSDALLSLGELNESKGLTTDAMKFYLAAADSLSKSGEKERLLGIYEKMLALSPSNVPLRSRIAEIYLKEGLVSEAVQQYLHMARLYVEKGDLEKSVEFFRKVLSAQPVHREAILDLRKVYEKTGDTDAAVDLMKEASELFPEDSEILLAYADLSMKRGDSAGAEKFLRRVIELEPGNIEARKIVGEMYLREGAKRKAWEEFLPVLDEMLLGENYDYAISLLTSFREIDPVETGRRLVSLYSQLGDTFHAVHETVALADTFLGMEKKREALEYYRDAVKMSPDDEQLVHAVVEVEKDLIAEHDLSPVEAVIAEADMYMRYRFYGNARELLEQLRDEGPENVDVRRRLKALYAETGEKGKAVGECIFLSEIYRGAGDIAGSKEMMRSAFEIDPDNPLLAEISTAEAGQEKEVQEAAREPVLEDYSEELAEAEFYSRQGLFEESREILERLQFLMPQNDDIRQRLAGLGQIPEAGQKEEEVPEREETLPALADEPEAAEVAEPAIDSDVMDIFNEFKKGLEKELEEEDYETHYNLGIAYKEMGLIDDAIREFQAARNDKKRFVHSSNMLGICYMEKGLYSLAVEVLKDAIGKMEDRGESYWAMKYDLGDAHEKNADYNEAFGLYTEVYGWNSKFRSVSDKIDHLKKVIAEGGDKKKAKDKRDRVSYL